MKIQLALQYVSMSLVEHLQRTVQINYVSRGTSVNSVEEFGKEAADLIQNNFYVDDLLKSVKNLHTAKTLVKNVINTCRSGGFNLTKFISNSKELLISIPEDERRPGVKDLEPN